MNHTEAAYSELFTVAFSRQLLRSILLAVIEAYKATPSAVKRAVDLPDRHDIFGTVRRGKIDELLRGVAELNHLRVEHSANVNGSWFFTSIFSGRFRLAAYLAGSGRRIRPAKIREAWAAHNHDGRWRSLFPRKEEPVSEDATYAAFLIHGPRPRHRNQPSYVEVVITDRDCKKFICRFELFKMFPEIAAQVVQPSTPSRKEPKPRKRRKEKGNEG
jgi:hypothetical protein